MPVARVGMALAISISLAAAAAEWSAPEDFDGRLETAHITWHFPERLRTLADELSRLAEEEWQEISARLGEEPAGRLLAALALDPASMRRAAPAGARVPEWAAGLAFPSSRLLLLSAAGTGGKPVEQVLPHELAHLLLALQSGGAEIPRWFQEGFAQLAADEWSFERARTLAWGALSGRLFGLQNLSQGFDSAPGEVELAYAQSIDFIGFLHERFGSSAMARLLSGLRGGAGFVQALEDATDMGLWQLDEEWRASLKRRFSWLPLVTGTAAVWTLALLAFLLAYLRRRRRRRAELERLGDGELPPDET